MNGNHVDICVNVHKGLRNLIGRFSFQTGSTDWTDAAAVSQLHTEWANGVKMIRSHRKHEDRFIHPLLARISPDGNTLLEAERRMLQSPNRHRKIFSFSWRSTITHPFIKEV